MQEALSVNEFLPLPAFAPGAGIDCTIAAPRIPSGPGGNRSATIAAHREMIARLLEVLLVALKLGLTSFGGRWLTWATSAMNT